MFKQLQLKENTITLGTRILSYV